MNVVHLMLSELKLVSRNRVAVAMLILMPIAMIALMGYAMKPSFEVQEKGIEKFAVLYANKDQGPVGRSFDTFMKEQLKDIIYVDEADGVEIEKELMDKKLPVAVVVPENLTAGIEKGERVEIRVITSEKDYFKELVAKSLVESFMHTLNTQAGINRGIKILLQEKDLAAETTNALDVYRRNSGVEFVSEEVIHKKASDISSFQYFGASMLIFFMLSTGMGLGISILEDRNRRIFSRINSFPVSKGQYLLGKTLGNSFAAVLQALIITLFGRFVFNINWGTNYFGLALTVLAIVIISSGIGVAAASLFNSTKALSTGLTVFFWIMTFVSGGFTPVPAFEPYAKFTVNKWAFDIISSLMQGGLLGEVLYSLAVLAVTCLVIWTSGLMLYRRRISYE